MDAEGKEKRRELPRRPTGQCFGCGQANPAGLAMAFAVEGEAVTSEVTVPAHLCGWGNVVHGGIVSTMLDEIMGWTAITFFRRLVLTKSLTVDFLRPVFAGEQLTVKGTIVDRRSEREALLAGEIRNPAGELCATGRAVFSLFTPEAARALAFLDEAVIEEFIDQFRT